MENISASCTTALAKTFVFLQGCVTVYKTTERSLDLPRDLNLSVWFLWLKGYTLLRSIEDFITVWHISETKVQSKNTENFLKHDLLYTSLTTWQFAWHFPCITFNNLEESLISNFPWIIMEYLYLRKIFFVLIFANTYFLIKNWKKIRYYYKF